MLRIYTYCISKCIVKILKWSIIWNGPRFTPSCTCYPHVHHDSILRAAPHAAMQLHSVRANATFTHSPTALHLHCIPACGWVRYHIWSSNTTDDLAHRTHRSTGIQDRIGYCSILLTSSTCHSLFSFDLSANQTAVLFYQTKSAPATSYQPVSCTVLL